MKTISKIGRNKPHPLYIPVDLAEVEGFIGDVPLFYNHKSVVIGHPQADLEEIEKSLKIILADIRFRIESENKKND